MPVEARKVPESYRVIVPRPVEKQMEKRQQDLEKKLQEGQEKVEEGQ